MSEIFCPTPKKAWALEADTLGWRAGIRLRCCVSCFFLCEVGNHKTPLLAPTTTPLRLKQGCVCKGPGAQCGIGWLTAGPGTRWLGALLGGLAHCWGAWCTAAVIVLTALRRVSQNEWTEVKGQSTGLRSRGEKGLLLPRPGWPSVIFNW